MQRCTIPFCYSEIIKNILCQLFNIIGTCIWQLLPQYLIMLLNLSLHMPRPDNNSLLLYQPLNYRSCCFSEYNVRYFKNLHCRRIYTGLHKKSGWFTVLWFLVRYVPHTVLITGVKWCLTWTPTAAIITDNRLRNCPTIPSIMSCQSAPSVLLKVLQCIERADGKWSF